MKKVKSLCGTRVSNKVFYLVLVFVVLLAANLTVLAYGSSADPSVFGHSAGEMEVDIGGSSKTLQAAIDAGDFGSDDRYSIVAPTNADYILVDRVAEFCADGDGCNIRIIATLDDVASPRPFISETFFDVISRLDDESMWRAQAYVRSDGVTITSKFGQDMDGSREDIIRLENSGNTFCIFRDGGHSGDEGDDQIGYGFKESSTAPGYLSKCELIIVD
jgi:hypothetical protein